LREEPTGADFAPVKSPLFSIKPKVGSGTKNARNVSIEVKKKNFTTKNTKSTKRGRET
jgi:hypothetical protein